MGTGSAREAQPSVGACPHFRRRTAPPPRPPALPGAGQGEEATRGGVPKLLHADTDPAICVWNFGRWRNYGKHSGPLREALGL